MNSFWRQQHQQFMSLALGQFIGGTTSGRTMIFGMQLYNHCHISFPWRLFGSVMVYLL